MNRLKKNQKCVELTDVIAPAFYEAHWDILENKHTYYDLSGGRGSCKSSFASVEIVNGMMADPMANAIIFRKWQVALRGSVFEQIQWAIDKLGVSHLWKKTKSPLQHIYKKTGQTIAYHGLDDAKKTKSIKFSQGYAKYLWFEELDEFAGEQEIRTVQQSVLRGGPRFIVFKTFNPPVSAASWANEYVQKPKPDAYRLKSDYRSVPPEWLGPQFIADAEYLKETNEKAYRHNYLGEAVGTGTNVFEQLEIRTITDKEIENACCMDSIYQGQDWGWNPDPKAFIRCSYSNQKILVHDELGGCKIPVDSFADMIHARQYDDYQIFCGVDEEESISRFRDLGLPAQRALVRPGSRKVSFEWLQCRTIVVDPARTPQLYDELIHYESQVDNSGRIICAYPDGGACHTGDHYIDALRYALSSVYMRRGYS